MRNRVEQATRIRFTGANTDLRSVGENKGVHCLAKQEQAKEPAQPVDFRLFQLALTDIAGVSPQDARTKVKEMKKRYSEGDYTERERIGEVMGHAFVGIIRKDHSELQPVPVLTETVVYRRPR